ncbi:MAG: hypothetical protein V4622_01685 [Bacteroidota bacterium]
MKFLFSLFAFSSVFSQDLKLEFWSSDMFEEFKNNNELQITKMIKKNENYYAYTNEESKCYEVSPNEKPVKFNSTSFRYEEEIIGDSKFKISNIDGKQVLTKINLQTNEVGEISLVDIDKIYKYNSRYFYNPKQNLIFFVCLMDKSNKEGVSQNDIFVIDSKKMKKIKKISLYGSNQIFVDKDANIYSLILSDYSKMLDINKLSFPSFEEKTLQINISTKDDYTNSNFLSVFPSANKVFYGNKNLSENVMQINLKDNSIFKSHFLVSDFTTSLKFENDSCSFLYFVKSTDYVQKVNVKWNVIENKNDTIDKKIISEQESIILRWNALTDKIDTIHRQEKLITSLNVSEDLTTLLIGVYPITQKMKEEEKLKKQREEERLKAIKLREEKLSKLKIQSNEAYFKAKNDLLDFKKKYDTDFKHLKSDVNANINFPELLGGFYRQLTSIDDQNLFLKFDSNSYLEYQNLKIKVIDELVSLDTIKKYFLSEIDTLKVTNKAKNIASNNIDSKNKNTEKPIEKKPERAKLKSEKGNALLEYADMDLKKKVRESFTKIYTSYQVYTEVTEYIHNLGSFYSTEKFTSLDYENYVISGDDLYIYYRDRSINPKHYYIIASDYKTFDGIEAKVFLIAYSNDVNTKYALYYFSDRPDQLLTISENFTIRVWKDE